MGKFLNSNKWDKNDIRMLIVMILITVYPVLAGSLFMMFVFFVMPYQTAGMWPHIYWLIATAAWVLLLALILPLLRDNDDKKHALDLKPIETASKIKPLASNIEVEKTKESQEKTLPFEIQEESINEKTDNECFNKLDACEKSQNIKRSDASLNNSQVNLRASWGFLNSSLDSIENEKSSDRKSQNIEDNKDQEGNNSIEGENEIQYMRNKKMNIDCNADKQENIKDKACKKESINMKKKSDGSLNNSQVNLRASWGFLNSSFDSIENEKSSEVIHDTNKDQQDTINEVSEIKIKDLREEDIFQEGNNSIEGENKIQNMRNKKMNVDCYADKQENIKDKACKKESINMEKKLDDIDTINGDPLCTDDPCGSKSTTEEDQVIDIIEPNVKDSENTIEINELEAEIVVTDLEVVPVNEEKETRSVDRSGTSGYIESSIPWSASQIEKNAVFLFIKPEDE